MNSKAFDFPGNPFATPKALRASALKWQVHALAAQAKAITAIAEEHQISLADLAPESFVSRAEDLLRAATELTNRAPSEPLEQILREVEPIRQYCDRLEADVLSFVRLADQRAHFRLSSLLPVLFTGEPVDRSADHELDRSDAVALAAAAGSRCYHAESEQHGTFALQIKAICDLAMEMVLAAAAERAPAKE